MAWDAPRRHDPLPRTLRRPIFPVDDLNAHKTALETPEHIEDIAANMHAQLSPIEEERHFLPPDAPLLVRVTASFHDPAIRFTYDRTYHSSHSFTPSDRICQGLLRRIEHCSSELITRKDSDALSPTRCIRKGPKPVRFQLSFQVRRRGRSGIWAERSLTSYQKHALTLNAANEILRSTHTIVGMFLRRHDEAFEWTDEPGHDYFPEKPETFKPSLQGPLDLACVPRSHFIESRQAFEFVPGYSLELKLTSRNPARHLPEINRIVTVDSEQTTPLNLGMAEDLLWQAYKSLQNVLDQKKSSFDLEHATCDGFDGVPDCDCQHFDENALDVGLRIVNNLGPVYDHLHRSIQSSLRLFTHQTGQDCDDFVTKVQTRLQQFRARTDNKVASLNDFDFRIAELTGHGWQQRNCARFVIDGTQGHTRQSTQALLDRIRTGVTDVLRGNDVAIRMIAYKRGHLVLDKALVARDHKSSLSHGTLEPAEYQQHLILAQLKKRIQRDIDMICQDTCDLDESLEEDRGHEVEIRSPRPRLSIASRPFTPWETSSQRPNTFGLRSRDNVRTPSPVSPSRSPSRIFPLVPTKFKEKGAFESATVASVGALATGTMETTGARSLDALLRTEPAVDVEMSTDSQDKRKGTVQRTKMEGLKPPAEVYRSSKEEYDTDASSTHSSMPPLTERDTPSPDHSLLITPVCVRSSSPRPRGRSSIEDFNSLHFSHSFLINTSAPSSTTFAELDRFEDSKAGMLGENALPSDQPMTPHRPSGTDTKLGNISNNTGAASGDEKTPLAHRHMQELIKVNRQVDERVASETQPASAEDNGSEDTGPVLVLKQVAAETNSEPAIHDLHQGWLLYSVQEEGGLDQTPDETCKASEIHASLAEYDSLKTLKPSSLEHLGSIESLAGLRDCRPMDRDTGHHPQSVLVSTEQSDLCSRQDDANALKQTAEETEQPRVQVNVFKQDVESFGGSEVAESCGADRQKMGESERLDFDHVIPFSDSGIDVTTLLETGDKPGSKCDEKQILSPIEERILEFGNLNFDSDLLASSTELASGNPSGPLCSAIPPNELANIEIEGSEIPLENSKADREILASNKAFVPVKLPKVRTSGSGSRSISNPQPSQTNLGLGSAHLLPSLPVFSAFRSASHETRASWTSSSSWEDYVSSVRQSSDSVDTFKPSPTSSVNNDPHDSTKRLGTPTAGLLGLNESRWAEFGIRTALTGTHAFDHSSTAMVPEISENSCRAAQPGPELRNPEDKKAPERTLSPRKSLLKQKKSLGSLIYASKLKMKESKELRKQKSVELKSLRKIKSKSRESPVAKQDEDGGSRFPKAMMLVAGLAFASSVVSRNQS